MQWSDIDRRAKRTVPQQCLSDSGMHKDAGHDAVKPAIGRTIYKARPSTTIRTFRARSLKDDLAALRFKA